MMMDVSSPPEYASTTLSRMIAPRIRCRWADGAAQQGKKNGFLDVHAVFRLVVDHRVRRINDFSRHLLTTVRGQAVHEHRVARGQGKEFLVDLVRRENLLARRRLVLLAHAGPHVSVDRVSAGGRGNSV